MTGILHVWSAVWPNLLASLITFVAASVWHLALVRRVVRRHEESIKHHLDVHRRALDLHAVEEDHDRQRD